MDKLPVIITKIKNEVEDAMATVKKQWVKYLIYWGNIKTAEYVHHQILEQLLLSY